LAAWGIPQTMNAMDALPSFEERAGPLEPPVREPAMRAAFERLLTQGCLLDRLSDLASAEEFRWRAYRAVVLGKSGTAEELKGLIVPLREDPHGFVRACCAWALGCPSAPQDPDIDAALLDRVKCDPVWSVGRRAAISLGKRVPKNRLWSMWSEASSGTLLPWVRRGFVEALEPKSWPRAQTLAWLAEAEPEKVEALLWNLTPEEWQGLAVPSPVVERLKADPWLREHWDRLEMSR
jgi:HEAT repeat protein